MTLADTDPREALRMEIAALQEVRSCEHVAHTEGELLVTLGSGWSFVVVVDPPAPEEVW